MLPTPRLPDSLSTLFPSVYDAAEDTFLLLDALQKEKSFLQDELRPRICLEIGSVRSSYLHLLSHYVARFLLSFHCIIFEHLSLPLNLMPFTRSGSGCVICFLASILQTSAFYLTTDINSDATKVTQMTASLNGVSRDDS